MAEFLEAMKKRRSYYSIGGKSPITDQEVEDLVAEVLAYTPSSFNIPTTETLILLGEAHQKLWSITEEILKEITDPESFAHTKEKMASFSAGHGTILFYEDQSVIEKCQHNFPLYADNFPSWSLQQTGMAQYAVWTALEDAGLGVSLQHYNPLIDEQVAKLWSVPSHWKLIGQMPFGQPTADPSPAKLPSQEGRVTIKNK